MPQTVGRLTPISGRPRCPDCRETCRSCWRLRQWRMRCDRYIGGDRHAAFAALVTSDVSYRSCFAIKPCGMPQTVGRLTPRSGRPRCHDCRETCRSCWRLRQWRMRWGRYIGGDRHAAFAALVTSDVSHRNSVGPLISVQASDFREATRCTDRCAAFRPVAGLLANALDQTLKR
jgi:hypothetical protein